MARQSILLNPIGTGSRLEQQNQSSEFAFYNSANEVTLCHRRSITSPHTHGAPDQGSENIPLKK